MATPEQIKAKRVHRLNKIVLLRNRMERAEKRLATAIKKREYWKYDRLRGNVMEARRRFHHFNNTPPPW